MGLSDWLFGGKRPAPIQEEIASLCQELSIQEARLGLAELVSGLKMYEFYTSGTSGGLDWGKIRRDVEIVTNLHVYVKRLEGTPISFSDKGKYRVAITRAALKAMNKKAMETSSSR